MRSLRRLARSEPGTAPTSDRASSQLMPESLASSVSPDPGFPPIGPLQGGAGAGQQPLGHDPGWVPSSQGPGLGVQGRPGADSKLPRSVRTDTPHSWISRWASLLGGLAGAGLWASLWASRGSLSSPCTSPFTPFRSRDRLRTSRATWLHQKGRGCPPGVACEAPSSEPRGSVSAASSRGPGDRKRLLTVMLTRGAGSRACSSAASRPSSFSYSWQRRRSCRSAICFSRYTRSSSVSSSPKGPRMAWCVCEYRQAACSMASVCPPSSWTQGGEVSGDAAHMACSCQTQAPLGGLAPGSPGDPGWPLPGLRGYRRWQASPRPQPEAQGSSHPRKSQPCPQKRQGCLYSATPESSSSPPW